MNTLYYTRVKGLPDPLPDGIRIDEVWATSFEVSPFHPEYRHAPALDPNAPCLLTFKRPRKLIALSYSDRAAFRSIKRTYTGDVVFNPQIVEL